MQHTTAGNMINRPIGTMWKHPENGKTFMTWIQYEDYVFDHQFRLEKNRLLMFATSNRDNDNGKYYNYGKSGFVIRQGAGIRQQMESANTSYYGTFTIEYLLNYLMELSEGKLDLDTREFNGRTGERGAVQFHQSLEDHSQLFQPLFNQDRMFKISDPMAGGRLGLGYGGQFLRYLGPQGIVYSVSVDSLYSDRERNKIYHPSGGVAEAYRYDLMDIGTSEGEPNIMRVDVEGQSDIMGYEPGLRDPFSPTGGRNHIMSHATDGYTVHRMTTCGTKVHDPSRTASLIPNILE
jgi:hypothetical protein